MTFTERFEYGVITPPDEPGVYAVFLKDADALKPLKVESDKPLYIGMTNSSLRGRYHVEHKNSRFSTLRRSLGAILKEKRGLRTAAYVSGKPNNYQFENAGEQKLTDWMKLNLRFSYEVVDRDIAGKESSLILEYKPPLNLTKWRNPQKGTVQKLRKVCQDEAESAARIFSAPASSKPSILAAKRAAKAMVVAGVMSGTSADGVDVAVCRIAPGLQAGDTPRVKLLGHVGVEYPRAVRADVMRVMEGEKMGAAESSRLNWRLGGIYADAVGKAAEKFGVKIALVGMHGQTVHHEARGTGRSTWQMGEAAVVAERMRCPVVSDFRPADLAAGGQGAPLVPMLDWCMFRSKTRGRLLLNLGGIANMTAIPAGGGLEDVVAFDSGPGNMVIDACMGALYGRRFDLDGRVARRGRVLRGVVARVMREAYFPALPPKSCGREEFGAGFAARFAGMCRDAGGSDMDVVAAATALTAESVVEAYRRFVMERFEGSKVEVIVAGGGVRNGTLMGMLREGFGGLGVKMRVMEEVGIPAQAKEAVAFALLAWLTWHGLPGNVPAATGAGRAVVLGKVSFG